MAKVKRGPPPKRGKSGEINGERADLGKPFQHSPRSRDEWEVRLESALQECMTSKSTDQKIKKSGN